MGFDKEDRKRAKRTEQLCRDILDSLGVDVPDPDPDPGPEPEPGWDLVLRVPGTFTVTEDEARIVIDIDDVPNGDYGDVKLDLDMRWGGPHPTMPADSNYQLVNLTPDTDTSNRNAVGLVTYRHEKFRLKSDPGKPYTSEDPDEETKQNQASSSRFPLVEGVVYPMTLDFGDGDTTLSTELDVLVSVPVDARSIPVHKGRFVVRFGQDEHGVEVAPIGTAFSNIVLRANRA